MRLTVLGFSLLVAFVAPAMAATCGNTGSGFEKWKASYADQMAAQGVGRKGLAALAETHAMRRPPSRPTAASIPSSSASSSSWKSAVRPPSSRRARS